MSFPTYALLYPTPPDGEDRHIPLRANSNGELLVSGGGDGGGGGGGTASVSPQDLADGAATAPSSSPANGSELNLLKQIVDRSVGAPTWESASVTVGTTSTQLAPARPGRTTVSLNNVSTGGQTITLTGGATIPPGAARDIPTTAAIFGVSSAAGGVIHVVETY